MKSSEVMNLFSLEGKTALVTGACYGIGFAIATALHGAGAKIAFCATSDASVEKALKAYEAEGITDVKGYACDVTNEERVRQLITDVERDVAPIDILVNNAGIIKRIPMCDMAVEDFRRVVDVDLVAPYIVSKAVLPGMIERGHGKIINVCSILSELGRETGGGLHGGQGRPETADAEYLRGVWRKEHSVQRHWPGLHCHAADRTPAGAAERRQPSSL